MITDVTVQLHETAWVKAAHTALLGPARLPRHQDPT
jgi:hypothetical protein